MGIITKIETQKRNKERVNIYIDEEYAFAVFSELVYKNGLKVKQEIDEETLKDVFLEEEKKKCKSTAIRIVERSYKTEKELREKLTLKGYDKSSIEYALEFLKEYNFLNDESYSKMFVKDSSRSKGKNRIKMDLKRKGVSEENIQDALSNINKEEEFLTAKKLGEKKYNQLIKREDDKYKLSSKLLSFLVSKGFEYELSKDVVRKITTAELDY